MITTGLDRNKMERYAGIPTKKLRQSAEGTDKFPAYTESDEEQWLEEGFDAEQIRQFQNAGVKYADEAKDWLSVSSKMGDIAAWKNANFNDPRIVQQWIAAGFEGPKSAGRWHSIGLNPDQANEWVDTGIEPHKIQEWVDVGEISSNPAEVIRWMNAGFEPKDAETWYSSGVTDPDTAKKWLEAGFDSDTAASINYVSDDPEKVKPYYELGLSGDAIKGLIEGGVSPNGIFRSGYKATKA